MTSPNSSRYAKANPGKLNYASVGNGSSSHLNMELFKSVAGFDAVHVPFNGSPPAVKATVQNETQMMFAVMQPLQAQIQAGTLRALAVTTGEALSAAARPADDRGIGLSGLRGARLERRARRGEHAAPDHRAAQRRNERGAEGSRRRCRKCTASAST